MLPMLYVPKNFKMTDTLCQRCVNLFCGRLLTGFRLLVSDYHDAGLSEEHQECDSKEEGANGQNQLNGTPVLFASCR